MPWLAKLAVAAAAIVLVAIFARLFLGHRLPTTHRQPEEDDRP